MFARWRLVVASRPWWKPLCVSSLFCGDRMCPRRFEAKFTSGFFCGLFRWRFDHRPQWIA
jgi:hypothetical protein